MHVHMVAKGNLSDLKHIVELDLSQNLLSALPDAFGSLSNLQKLDLFKNKLTTLPLTFAQLKKLKWLDLKDNNLETGLQVAGGTCLDDSECRACATNASWLCLFAFSQSSVPTHRLLP